MSSIRDAHTALIDVVNDPELDLDPDERETLYLTIGLLDDLDDE